MNSNGTVNETGRKKILVVDNDPPFIRTIRESLGDSYLISTASSKREGLERAAAERPDLLIVGYIDGVGDACGFCRELESRVEIPPAPLLVVDVGLPDYMRKGWRRRDLMETNAVAYLVRPVSGFELRREVERVLGEGAPGRGAQDKLKGQVEDVLRQVNEIEKLLAP